MTQKGDDDAEQQDIRNDQQRKPRTNVAAQRPGERSQDSEQRLLNLMLPKRHADLKPR